MRILIVGPLSGPIAEAAKIALAKGAKVAQVETIEAATAHARERGADLLLVDLALDIAALIAANAAERIHIPVAACGVGAEPAKAAAAIRAGAKEYIPLPPDANLISAVLAAIAASDERRPLIAEDPAMQAVLKLADQIAASEASVLITGESGVGKEVVARYLHARSKRAAGPFVAVNCAAIPENLLESELFGHEKGAFTGAIARRIGKFEEADGGTLLLDEVTEMDLRLQAKLLRALQERVIDRVGGQKPVAVNIRVLATSNRDLATAVSEGAFRQDLYYRLNVVNLRIPPLRERKADIPALARFFIEKYSAIAGRASLLSDEALARIQAHPWFGNVRELENAMHRAVLLSPAEHIEPEVVTPGASMPAKDAAIEAGEIAALVGRTVADVEQELILETLKRCLGNRTHAANILGISIRTLRNKLKLYGDAGIDVPPAPTGIAGL